MANPVVTALTADTWVKVATGVKRARVLPLKYDVTYVQTYRLTGDPAPSDFTDAKELRYAGVLFCHSASIDCYVAAIGAAGSVRVEV